jgi:uncharacterized membrane protein
MTYSPLLIVHICGGIAAILSGYLSLLVRKGSRLHRISGDVFVISMLFMAGGGAYIALVKSQPMNVLAGVFTFYLVTTAWLTVKRKANETGLAERGLMLLAVAAGAGASFLGWRAANVLAKPGHAPAAMYVVFASIALISVIGDSRMLIRGGVSGGQRLARHLWRMCFALFVAAGSFFLGMSTDPVLRRNGLRATLFTEAVRQTHLPAVPVFLVLALMIFWLIRVRFASAYKRSESRRTTAAREQLA